jgi:hypothetical protein
MEQSFPGQDVLADRDLDLEDEMENLLVGEDPLFPQFPHEDPNNYGDHDYDGEEGWAEGEGDDHDEDPDLNDDVNEFVSEFTQQVPRMTVDIVRDRPYLIAGVTLPSLTGAAPPPGLPPTTTTSFASLATNLSGLGVGTNFADLQTKRKTPESDAEVLENDRESPETKRAPFQ